MSGGNAVIFFHMPTITKEEAYSVGGGTIYRWQRRTLSVVAYSVGYAGGGKKGKLVQIMRKCNVEKNRDKR